MNVENEDVPVCPKCGHRDIDWWDGIENSKSDGESWESDCPFCGSDYRVTIHLATRFDTQIEESATP